MTPTLMMEDCFVVCEDLQSAIFFFSFSVGLIGSEYCGERIKRNQSGITSGTGCWLWIMMEGWFTGGWIVRPTCLLPPQAHVEHAQSPTQSYDLRGWEAETGVVQDPEPREQDLP